MNRITSQLLAAFLLPIAFLPGAESPAPQPTLRSTAFDWDKLPPQASAIGVRRLLADNPTVTLKNFECHITTLDAGKVSHAPLRHAQEKVIVIKDGAVEMNIDGKIHQVGAGDLVFLAANANYGLRNPGTVPSTYFVLTFSSEATRSSPDANAPVDPSVLGSTVYPWDKLAVRKSRTGESRNILSSRTSTLSLLDVHGTLLNPGEAPHAPHRHPYEEIVAVREGTLEVTINGTAQRIGPGSLLFLSSGDLHGWRNVGTVPAVYYVFRVETAATPKAVK